MEEVTKWTVGWLDWNASSLLLIVVGAALWAPVHELSKVATKSFFAWLWPKLFKKPYPIPYNN
jgi:hypothetical protein